MTAFDEGVERGLDGGGIVTIDVQDVETGCFEPGPGPLRTLLFADGTGLPVCVAVEDRQDVGQIVVHDEVERLGDLSLAGFTVADDAEDPLVEPVQAGRKTETGRGRESLTQRTSRGIEEGESLPGVRVAVERRIGGTELVEIGHRRRPSFPVTSDVGTEIREGGVDDRHGVAFGEDEPV